MTLAFSTELKGKPTFFVEKIWESILRNGIEVNALEFSELGRKAMPKGYKVGTHNTKLHTIRRDTKNRWKAGNDIHFVINNRTPNRFQFAPVVKCVSTQEIEILWFDKNESDIPCSTYLIKEEQVGEEVIEWEIPIAIWIDNEKLLSIKEVETLAINDGFDSVEDFFAYFSEDFKGKIIHWTPLKY